MTKITRFLPLVCVLLISGWFAPAASASPQTALSLNDRLASSPSGTVGLLSLAAPAAPYTETDTYYEGAEGKTGESLKAPCTISSADTRCCPTAKYGTR